MNVDREKLKGFLGLVSDKIKISALELIEKDFYLSFLLTKLNLEDYAFKGGTCLAKAYLDYFRFSEDLDFTFINQRIFDGKSTKTIKKICKERTEAFGKQLENASLDFKFDKADTKYVMIGSNNKLVTFKVYYESVLTGNISFVKIQINFLEKIVFPIHVKELSPLAALDNFTNENKIYFKELIDFYKPIKVQVYDIKEIAAEKVRSLLTRKAIKSRDAIDLLFIYNNFNINLRDFLKEIKEKLLFSINMYGKYRDNILSINKIQKLEFNYEEVRDLVIKPFEKKDFEDYVRELKPLLIELAMDV